MVNSCFYLFPSLTDSVIVCTSAAVFGVGFCLCGCLLLFDIVSIKVAGKECITGLGVVDLGDSVTSGMTAA